ncbi:hypothetical protein [Adhaeribacter radiodurans]|uniref:Lipoprotein n=1 Tax=Adhaeribacter radiodurans TaxID=2745197 RepID=A0A7L7L6V9_9BACT|nr:hypothetical protein [Adhaeribacter radiodurans]QMU28537.1 hypothetical protein HUW48_11025 [Adhaeribacter radiodurans]
MINSKKINVYHSFLSLLVMLLSACCSNNDLNLNETIKAWAPYQLNQEVTFKNENQDSITFKVRKLNRREVGHDKVCGDYQIESAESILINQADTAFQLNIILTQEVLVKINSYYKQPPAKNVDAMFNSVSKLYITNDWRDQYLIEITLNGITYKNVLHIYGNNVPNPISFSEIYYSREVGLVAFNISAGGWFYLQ